MRAKFPGVAARDDASSICGARGWVGGGCGGLGEGGDREGQIVTRRGRCGGWGGWLAGKPGSYEKRDGGGVLGDGFGDTIR